MSIANHSTPQRIVALEEYHWKIIPQKLRGKAVKSLEGLNKRVQNSKHFGEVFPNGYDDSESYTRYSRHPKNIEGKEMLDITIDVAYDCPKCREIVIGRPVKTDTSFGEQYACTVCEENMNAPTLS